jgi:hypothetical protein
LEQLRSHQFDGGVRSAPFLVLALPRSRTAWLSRFLSYGDVICLHEEARHLRSMEDVKSWLNQPFVGSVETAIAPFWRLLTNARIVVVRRPVEEVVESLLRAGTTLPRSNLTCLISRLDAKLDQIQSRLTGVLTITYEELDTPEGCRRVFEFTLQRPFDEAWWRFLAPINIQAPVWGMERYITSHLPQLSRMAGEAKREILRNFASRRRHFGGPLRVAPEDFAKWLVEGYELFREHGRYIGRDPDDMTELNWPVMGTMAARGELFVIGAREGSRLVGYAVVILGNDIMKCRVVASLVFLFALPAFPLLGLRLAREAFREARVRGASVGWLFRTRDSSHSSRLGVLAERLGATELSSTFEVTL